MIDPLIAQCAQDVSAMITAMAATDGRGLPEGMIHGIVWDPPEGVGMARYLLHLHQHVAVTEQTICRPDAPFVWNPRYRAGAMEPGDRIQEIELLIRAVVWQIHDAAGSWPAAREEIQRWHLEFTEKILQEQAEGQDSGNEH